MERIFDDDVNIEYINAELDILIEKLEEIDEIHGYSLDSEIRRSIEEAQRRERRAQIRYDMLPWEEKERRRKKNRQ